MGNLKITKTSIITFCIVSLVALMLIICSTGTAYGLSDGAYTVSRSTSYVNPATGKPADGGTNIELGESMCSGIIENKILVEKVDNTYYVTMGIGLMSNISSVKINVQTSNNSYSQVPITKTGSCTRDGDTCNHYRFKVSSLSKLISPELYVEPMGRTVKFFVDLNESSAVAGTGNYVSQMVKKSSEGSSSSKSDNQSSTASESSNSSVEEENQESTAAAAEEELTGETDTENAKEESETKEKSSTMGIVAVVIIVILAGGVCLTYCLRKKRIKR